MTDGHTIDVGYVHVLEDVDGPCRPDCPHPDHQGKLRCPSCLHGQFMRVHWDGETRMQCVPCGWVSDPVADWEE